MVKNNIVCFEFNTDKYLYLPRAMDEIVLPSSIGDKTLWSHTAGIELTTLLAFNFYALHEIIQLI